MSINITKQVIESLCRQSKEFKLFFESHFKIKTKQSIVPRISDDDVSFPVEMFIIPKKLTLDEKMKYYENDVNQWNRVIKELPLMYIMLKYELEKISGWED